MTNLNSNFHKIPRQVRRALMFGAIRGALSLSRYMSPRTAVAFGTSLGEAARLVPPLRSRLTRNLVLGFKARSVPAGTAEKYFQNLGRSYGWAMDVYHRGFWRSCVPDCIEFDDSVSHLDQAVARGKGVIVVMTHQFCYELAGAYINGRHKAVAIVREQDDPRRVSLKSQWYNATGLTTVRRPRHSSLAADMYACLSVLKSGSLLGITPDTIVSRTSGVPVEMFGREVNLSPGFLLIAMRAQAPVVTGHIRWKTPDRLVINFTEPREYSRRGDDLKTRLTEGLQSWCREFEERVLTSPQDWMFWLDKRWTKVFRSQSNGAGML